MPWLSHPMGDGLPVGMTAGFIYGTSAQVSGWKLFRGIWGRVSTIAFSPDGSVLASGGSWNDATIRLWDLRTATATHALAGHKDGVTSVTYSPDGLMLASGGSDDTIRLWDANTGELLRTLEGHTSGVGSVAFSP